MSKTSLKRFKNEKLQEKYREQNDERCEVFKYMKKEEQDLVKRLRVDNPEWLELHHILRQPHYRVDNWSNFIIISSLIHIMAHGGYQREVTTACLYAKWRKAEFDIHELNTAGPKTIRGELSNLMFKLKHKPAYVDMCEQMLKTIPKD